jgi:hypothetical protein
MKSHVTIMRSCVTPFMGELIDVGQTGGFGVIPALLSVAALGLFALLQQGPSNDDDDSGPGGGLMQPVA